MSNTTRRDGYRMAALQGLLAGQEEGGWDYDALVSASCTIGDMMEARARADYAERENGNGKREESAVKTCETCEHLERDCLRLQIPCLHYSAWQPRADEGGR